MSDVTQGNATEARDATGTIVDQQAITQSTETTQKTETTKEGETKLSETKVEDAKKPEPGAVPDKYEFKAPEGRQVDTKLVEAATPIFKELGLSQENAQKLFDLHTQLTAERETQIETTMTAMRKEWRDAVIADKSLSNGKDGLSPEASKDIAQVFTALGPKAATDLKAAMDLTGAGDHPAIVSAYRTLGKLLSEGTPVRGAGPSPAGQVAPGTAPQSAAQRMYPNLPSSNAR